MLRDIINTYRQAFRVFLRQRTRPLSLEEAENKRLFWSKVYVTFAFSTLIWATYLTKARNINFNYREDIPKKEAVLEKLLERPSTVITFRNFKKVDEIEYTPQEETVGKWWEKYSFGKSPENN